MNCRETKELIRKLQASIQPEDTEEDKKKVTFACAKYYFGEMISSYEALGPNRFSEGAAKEQDQQAQTQQQGPSQQNSPAQKRSPQPRPPTR
uniref:Vta1 domain-containing protein n=1 Tax=Mesocestoides corti TaxID=53468 RepID=A0A5K3EX34_MESCO